MKIKRMLAAAALMLLCMLAPAAGTAAPYRVDGIAAVVDGEVITESELNAAVAVDSHRTGVGPAGVDAAYRRGVLDNMVDRILIMNEAHKFNIVEVTDQEVEDALASLAARYGSTEALVEELDANEMTLDELRDNIREQITVIKYVDRRIRFFVRVTLDDQKRYYDEHASEFGMRPFDEVSEDIRELLIRKRSGEKLDEYIGSLRNKADIRYPSGGDE